MGGFTGSTGSRNTTGSADPAKRNLLHSPAPWAPHEISTGVGCKPGTPKEKRDC